MGQLRVERPDGLWNAAKEVGAVEHGVFAREHKVSEYRQALHYNLAEMFAQLSIQPAAPPQPA